MRNSVKGEDVEKACKYKFMLYHYGNLVSTRYFETYEEARKFYCGNYYQYEFAVVPYVSNRRLTFNEAYDLYRMQEYSSYVFGRTPLD